MGELCLDSLLGEKEWDLSYKEKDEDLNDGILKSSGFGLPWGVIPSVGRGTGRHRSLSVPMQNTIIGIDKNDKVMIVES